MKRNLWAIVPVLAVMALLPAFPPEAEAVLNNGFETDYAYIIKEDGTLRSVRESDGVQMGADLLPPGSTQSLTFAGTGSNDARLFVATVQGDDILLGEVNAAGAIINGPKNLSTILGAPVGTGPYMGCIRYSPVSNTLFIGLNPNPATTGPGIAYEIDLALTTRIHTYVGPSCPSADARQVGVAVNPRNGTLYMISRGLGGTVGRGDLVAFNTAGRPVGGSTSTYTTLINGVAFNAVDGRYAHPNNVIYRKQAGTGSEDTLIIPMQPTGNAEPALEFWVDTAAHSSGNPNYLALRGPQLATKRGWNGQQDNVTGHVWLAALRGGFHVIRTDDTTASFDTTRNYADAASPSYVGPVPPSIAEVTPDPKTIASGGAYVQQLSLVSGTAPVTWSLLQGPPGAQVNPTTGLVSGWTPGEADIGQSIAFNVQATNSAGSDTESWQVSVIRGNNGFATAYVYMVRRPNNGGQVRAYVRSDGTQIVPDLIPDGINCMTGTFSGKGHGNDARLFLAKLNTGGPPDSTGTDVIIMEVNFTGQIVKTVNLSTILGGPVGSAVALGNLRYSSVSNTLFLGLNPGVGADTAAVAYEIDLALTTRLHTYVGETIPASVAAYDARVTVAINSRSGALYMISQSLGDAAGTGLGDVIAFNTTGRPVGGTTSTFTVVVDGQTMNAANPGYVQPSSPIYRKRSGGDDTLLIPTNTAADTPVLEFYLNTTLHPVDGSGNLAFRTDNPTPLTIGRGWNGQQDPGSGEVWLGADHYGIHLIAGNDATASYETGRQWMDAAVPPFVPCNESAFDSDGDQDVDQDDFGVLQLCYGMPAPLTAACACFDRGDQDNNGAPEQDGVINQFDITAFNACALGPAIVAAPGCGD